MALFWSDAHVHAVAFALVAASATPALADEDAGPFAQGRMRLSLGLGSTQSDGDTGIVAGGAFGYFVRDGLEVGLGVDRTFGLDPGLTRVTPDVRYVLHFVPVLKPYAGAFYRRWFIDGEEGADSVGARAGAFWVSSGGSFFGGGVVYERLVSDCQDDCAMLYPELALSLSL